MPGDAKYRLLVESLRKSILDGKYDTARPFPSERMLIRTSGHSRIPVVIIDNYFSASLQRGGYAYDVVGIDNVAAGSLVAGHLAGLGVRRIAFQKRPKCSSSVNDRWRGDCRGNLRQSRRFCYTTK